MKFKTFFFIVLFSIGAFAGIVITPPAPGPAGMATDFSNSIESTASLDLGNQSLLDVGFIEVVDGAGNSTSNDKLWIGVDSEASYPGNSLAYIVGPSPTSGTVNKLPDLLIKPGEARGSTVVTIRPGSLWLQGGDIEGSATAPITGEFTGRSGRNLNASAVADTAQAKVESGYNDGIGDSGDQISRTGYTANGNSGDRITYTGDAVGDSGDQIFWVGTATGAQGVFKILKKGVNPSVGDIFTSSSTDGTGYWNAPIDISGTRGSPTAIVAANGILFTSISYHNLHFVEGSGGAVDITADPQIAAGTNIGQRLILIGRNGTNTVTLEDGTGLSLSSTMVLGYDSVIELMWDSSRWTELSRR